jgi:hypothetical protein
MEQRIGFAADPAGQIPAGGKTPLKAIQDKTFQPHHPWGMRLKCCAKM